MYGPSRGDVQGDEPSPQCPGLRGKLEDPPQSLVGDCSRFSRLGPLLRLRAYREGRAVLMSSTPFAYPQVIMRTFASFRVPKSYISAVQRPFWVGSIPSSPALRPIDRSGGPQQRYEQLGPPINAAGAGRWQRRVVGPFSELFSMRARPGLFRVRGVVVRHRRRDRRPAASRGTGPASSPPAGLDDLRRHLGGAA